MTAHRSVLLIHGMSSSQRTWWRTRSELEARGWAVDTVDLAGHGGRPLGGVRSLAALAEDVVAQRPNGCTLVVGHSLGALVALQLVTAMPTYARGVLLEDPPTRGNHRATGANVDDDCADDLDRDLSRARTDPAGAVASLLRGHPTWSRRDARTVLEGRLLTDPRIAQLVPVEGIRDLPTAVAACPVPVALVAALGVYSALFGSERTALLRLLPSERVTEMPGSHHLHLDEPGRWVEAVDTFGASLL